MCGVIGIACTNFCVGPVGGSLDPEGGHSALVWNNLGGHSNWGGVILPSDNGNWRVASDSSL